MILGGFFLGRSVPNIGQRIHYVIVVVALVSILPAIIGILRSRQAPSAKPGARKASPSIDTARG
jgi:hypothetical protein